VILSLSNYIEIIVYTVAIIIVVIINTILFLRTKKIDLVYDFFRLQVLMGIWIVAKIFKVISLEDEIWVWVIIEYIGICYFGVGIIEFGHNYKYNKKLPKNWYYVLIAIATLNYISVFTNDYHHLFFKEVLAYDSPKGPLYYVHLIFSYITILFGFYMIGTSTVNGKHKMKERVILIVGLLFPLFVNIVYIFNVISIPFDITPIIYNGIMLSFGVFAFKNNYYDVQMMTRNMILENLYEAIVILDKDNRIIEYNKKMSQLLKWIISIKKYSKFEQVFALLEPYIIDFDTVSNTYFKFVNTSMTQTKTEIELRYNEKIYNFTFSLQKTYSKFGEYTGTIIKFVDMSEYHQLVRELESKNSALQQINRTLNENISVKKRLIVEQERNRASKEVHDILGHSVTLVISLLEMIKGTYEKEPDFAKEKVAQAMEITRKGIGELKKSLTHKKDTNITTQTLIEDLEKLTHEFSASGVEVEFITNHYKVKIQPKYYDSIYRICQESLTNALRHGKATKITIAVRFSEQSVDIIIADNGTGCKVFVKGNGIKGMEQRVNELDGFFSCGSPDGEGFNLHVTIPMSRDLMNINDVELLS
jgi:signal transduction histidine kinase